MPSPRAATLLTAGLALSVAAPARPSPAPAETAATPVVTIVRVKKPWYAPRSAVVRKMRETIPQYQSIPGLAYKIYSLTADGRYGGLYLWTDRASAEAWFSPEWFVRVQRERKTPGEVRFFDAPIVLDNTPGGTPANASSTAVASLVLLPVPAGASREKMIQNFEAAVPTYRKVPGLLRKAFVLDGAGRFGGVDLWVSRVDAERHYSRAWHDEARQRYGQDAEIEWFDAPILAPSTLATNRVALAE
ncbi:MAG TPA: hypothetical protein PLB01_07415 [Thermoanaerobaculia bacterium]|nr:hypothetical protein [Thermoanaerobaculia bacterium]